jgi:hypothetical protein
MDEDQITDLKQIIETTALRTETNLRKEISGLESAVTGQITSLQK